MPDTIFRCGICKELHNQLDEATDCENGHTRIENLHLNSVVYDIEGGAFPNTVYLEADPREGFSDISDYTARYVLGGVRRKGIK